MASRIHRIFLVIICAVVLTPTAPSTAQQSPQIPNAASRPFPISVPIGCLLASGCFVEAKGIEAGGRNVRVALPDVHKVEPLQSAVTSSDPTASGANGPKAAQLADAFLAKITKELEGISREELISDGPKPVGKGLLTPLRDELRVELSQYANGNDFFSCVLIFKALTRLNSDVTDQDARTMIAWDLYSRYIAACNKGTLSDLGDAQNRLVIFVRKEARGGYQAYCLGFNFSGNYILTAHHCLADPEEVYLLTSRYKPSDPDAFIVIDELPRESFALVLGEPNRLSSLKIPTDLDQQLNFYPFERNRDAIVLEIDSPGRRGPESFPIASPEEWNLVLIPSVFVEDDALSDALSAFSPETVAKVVAATSAVDVSPLCHIVYSKKSSQPFLFHACQTRYGSSGSPIFRRQVHGEIALIGIHTGSVDADNPVDGWPYAVIFPNYGLRVPDIVRDRSK
jgi:hypothetical protein